MNVALPAVQSALHATLADIQWVVESYALFLGALLLIGGSLGDLYGRRKIFAFGVDLRTWLTGNREEWDAYALDYLQ
jgi:MFS family permease